MSTFSPVKIPVAKGHISRQKTKSGVYIHYVLDRVYDKDKKYTVPKRTLIGKVCPDDPELMTPNEQYFECFPNEPRQALREEPIRCANVQIGPYIIIDHVATEICLKPLLDKHFGENAGLLLDWVSYMIVEARNQGQHYPDYAYTHALFTPKMRPLSDSTLSAFFAGVTQDQIIGFLNDWNAKREHDQPIYISYDSTNKNCQAGDINLLEFGKAKTDVGARIFNLSVAFDASNKVPLFYEQYPGSINDVSQFKFFVDKARAFNYTNVGFILDRGYFSRDNIEYLDKHGHRFVMMVKGCKPLVSALIDEVHGRFENDPDCVLQHRDISGITVKRKLYQGDTKERYFHVYYNPLRYAKQRGELLETIAKMRSELNVAMGTDLQLAQIYHDFFELIYNEKSKTLVHAKLRNDVVGALMKRLGYFCIITSEAMTAHEAYELYMGRDVSEKLFAATKTFLGSRSMRVHSEEALSAKVFAEFVALIIRNRIYNLLKNEIRRLPVRHNYMTVPAAIKELEKIAVVRINAKHYQLDHCVTKTQRTILSSFGLTPEYVMQKATELSAMLVESDAALSKEPKPKDPVEPIDYEGEN